jgi:hypothetical protein
MSATPYAPAATRAPTDPMRHRARLAGVLYVLTFVSIPTLSLYKPVKDDVGAFLLGAGSDTGVMVGALSEVIIGVAGISTAVVLFPVLKRQNQSAALGIVTARLVETSLIFVGAVCMLTVVTLRNDVIGTAGTDPASLTITGHTLVAVYTWTFLLSQSLMPVFVDLLLGYVLYRSGLVHRVLPMIAFVGAPLLLASDLAIFFGVYENVSPLALVAAIPVAVFELSFGGYLIVKGFKPSSPLLTQPMTDVRMRAPVPAPRTATTELDEQGADVG